MTPALRALRYGGSSQGSSLSLQARITAAAALADANGITVAVDVPDGTSYISSALSIPIFTNASGKVLLRGTGSSRCTLQVASGATLTTMLNVSPSAFGNPWATPSQTDGSPVTLSSVTEGSLTVTRTGGATASTGFYLLADDSLLGSGAGKYKAFTVKVTAVNGNTITLSEGAPHDFSTGTVQMWPISQKVQPAIAVSGITFDGYNGSAYLDGSLIQGWGLNSFEAIDVVCKRYATDGIVLRACNNITTTNCGFNTCDPAYNKTAGRAYGLTLYRCNHITDSGMVVDDMRHGISLATSVNATSTGMVGTNIHASALDTHGQDSRHVTFSNFNLTKDNVNDGAALVSIGNPTFGDWDQDVTVNDGDLNGGRMEVRSGKNVTVNRVINIDRYQLDSYNNAIVGSRPMSNVLFYRCIAYGYTGQGYSISADGGDSGMTVEWEECLFRSRVANTDQLITISDPTAAIDFTYTNCWLDRGLGSNNPGIFLFGTAANSNAITIRINGGVHQSDGGASCIPIKYSTGSGFNSPLTAYIDNLKVIGKASVVMPSGAPVTVASNTGNTASISTHAVPTTIAEMLQGFTDVGATVVP